MKDEAQELYAKRRKTMDLDREVDTYAMWSFGLAIIDLVLLGIAFVGWALFPFAAIASIVCGIVAIRRIGRDTRVRGTGFAIAGIVISSAELIGAIVALVLLR